MMVAYVFSNSNLCLRFDGTVTHTIIIPDAHITDAASCSMFFFSAFATTNKRVYGKLTCRVLVFLRSLQLEKLLFFPEQDLIYTFPLRVILTQVVFLEVKTNVFLTCY